MINAYEEHILIKMIVSTLNVILIPSLWYYKSLSLGFLFVPFHCASLIMPLGGMAMFFLASYKTSV